MALEQEYNYFLKNRPALLKDYKDQFIVIVGEKVVGSYSSQEEALKDASVSYALGSFLIQKVSETDEDTTQRFFSRVIIHK
jgi:hypothetical protein